MDKYTSQKIRKEIRKILIFEWDPIGVFDIPEAHDEYDFYVGDLFELINSGASDTQIADHLHKIETERMRIPRLSSRDNLLDISKKLIEVFQSIHEENGV